MAATFDPSLTTPRDWMRSRLGDTDIDNPFAPDETYDAYLMDAGGSWRLAAAAMARSFASQAVRKPSSFTATGDMSIAWNNQSADWLRIAAALEAEASRLDTSGGFWSAPIERGDLVDERGEYSIELKRR